MSLTTHSPSQHQISNVSVLRGCHSILFSPVAQTYKHEKVASWLQFRGTKYALAFTSLEVNPILRISYSEARFTHKTGRQEDTSSCITSQKTASILLLTPSLACFSFLTCCTTQSMQHLGPGFWSVCDASFTWTKHQIYFRTDSSFCRHASSLLAASSSNNSCTRLQSPKPRNLLVVRCVTHEQLIRFHILLSFDGKSNWIIEHYLFVVWDAVFRESWDHAFSNLWVRAFHTGNDCDCDILSSPSSPAPVLELSNRESNMSSLSAKREFFASDDRNPDVCCCVPRSKRGEETFELLIHHFWQQEQDSHVNVLNVEIFFFFPPASLTAFWRLLFSLVDRFWDPFTPLT